MERIVNSKNEGQTLVGIMTFPGEIQKPLPVVVLLHGFIEVDLPKGYFMVLGDTQVTVDASESDLGDTVNLYYSEAS